MKARVELQIDNQVALVKLNRPEKHNALDMPMFYAIDKVIRQLKKEKAVRCVIVSGNGESFCSGLDVKSVMTNRKSALKLLWKWWPRQANMAQRVTVGWRHLKVPVIMAVHGKCWGAGMQIALGGDFRIAAADTSLAIMEARWGLIPDMGGTLALRENMPVDRAMQLAMMAEPIGSDKALEMQLITQISNDPLTASNQLAEQLKQRSPDTNYRIKKLYHQIWSRSEGKVLAGETLNQWRILLGKNQRIAVKRQTGQSNIDYV
ncbi:crotonase/enoyl-CoA hydratase family protein [Aliikangiella coralliicola]|uniref:Crotonase/enoyl-CoA hydratase family protein n=1 Tax=Aliikangiella coralliicola TaxID=2592383 RepID=A0A545UBS0_9GAMM|nr:crotonase/enoyl-CoA hydratase family protein [Aliikangiella coralliicola]TQV86908.1 crotonase/enoyl-CoA hydratase family protein [Aliikangiella coralliicola]